MLTSVLLDERTIPQPAFGTLLPCRKGEGTGMRVAIDRHGCGDRKTYTGPRTGRNGESKQFVKKLERKLLKRYLPPFGFSNGDSVSLEPTRSPAFIIAVQGTVGANRTLRFSFRSALGAVVLLLNSSTPPTPNSHNDCYRCQRRN